MFAAGACRFRIAVLPVLLATALAGCADLHWHKAGATAETLKEDLDQCRTGARLQPARGPWGEARPPMITVDRFGLPVVVQQQPYDSERFLAEYDYVSACMHQKGYERAPERPASGRN